MKSQLLETLKDIIGMTFVALALAAIMHMPVLDAQDAEDDAEVTHCINYETGEVIAVEEGMPCPFPMAEL